MHAIVTGAAGGLGSLLCKQLAKHYTVTDWDLPNQNVTDSRNIKMAVQHLNLKKLDLLVNCAGINQPAYLPELTHEAMHKHMAVNAMGIFNCVRALLPLLQGGTVCNIISNASHMPMTASLAYNVSKAAAWMMTKQMAHELWPTHQLVVFGVSPNRLAGTPMSKAVDTAVAKARGWSLDTVKDQQLNRLPLGEETPPTLVAEFCGWLLAKRERHKYLAGCVLPYGAPHA